MYRLDGEGRMQRLIDDGVRYSRRQDVPPVVAVNGAVYVAEWSWFRSNKSFIGTDTRAYIMPAERSIDIDSEMDFALAQLLLERISSPA